MKILSNQRHCTTCNDSPYSAHRHDCRHCKCGAVMVDGGMSYIRHNMAGTDMSIIISDEHYDLLVEALDDPHIPNRIHMLRGVLNHELKLSTEQMNEVNKHQDALFEAITDPTRNTLGHICNMVRILRDDIGVNLSDYSTETE